MAKKAKSLKRQAPRKNPAPRRRPAAAKRSVGASRVVIDPGWTWDDNFPLSQGVRIGDLLYLSGQIAVDDSGNIIGRGDLGAQTRQVFENIKTILRQAGAAFEDIFKMNTYFVSDIHNYEDYFAVRREYLKSNRPASTGVQVMALAFEGLLLEVEAIARIPQRRR